MAFQLTVTAMAACANAGVRAANAVAIVAIRNQVTSRDQVRDFMFVAVQRIRFATPLPLRSLTTKVVINVVVTMPYVNTIAFEDRVPTQQTMAILVDGLQLGKCEIGHRGASCNVLVGPDVCVRFHLTVP